MKTKNLKFLIPEIYLIVATLYYWTLTSNIFNPFAIVLVLILTYQIVSKNAITGLIIATVFLLLNLYLVLALLSELNDFNNTDKDFRLLFIFGNLFIGLNICFSIIMLIKYLKQNNQLTKTL